MATTLLAMGSVASAVEYRVRSGDTLSRIAAHFGVSVEAIKSANDLRDDMIFPGEVLQIPTEAEEAPRGETWVYMVLVRSGDTLAEIAARERITVAALKAANGLEPGPRGDTIHPGQDLVIPATRYGRGSSGTTVRASAPRVTDAELPSRHPAMRVSEADVEVLARIVKGECPPSVPWEGKVAVAAVVLNRVRSGQFPNTIPGVAHQRLQFSCYNANNRRRLYYGAIPNDAWAAARAALAGEDPSHGSTYYFNPFLVRPSWARNLDFVRRIGDNSENAHDFYRTRQETERRRLRLGAAGSLDVRLGGQ